MCCYVECRYAECCLFIVMLGYTLNAVMPGFIMLSVIMASVVVPKTTAMTNVIQLFWSLLTHVSL